MNNNFDKKLFRYFQIFIAVLLLCFVVKAPVLAATIEQMEQQRDYKEAQRKKYEEEAKRKASEVVTIKGQISEIESQIDETVASLNSTLSDISKTESRINELSQNIRIQEDNYAREAGTLEKVVVSWYMEGEDSFLETVFGSKNLSEMMSKQQYYESLRRQIKAKMDEINAIKEDLSAQRNEQQTEATRLNSLKTQQEGEKRTVENQKNQKDRMLKMTASQQANYLAEVEKLKNEINQISAEIYAQRLKQKNKEQWIYGSSSYPFSAINSIDPWLFYTRQCTSYAAWYWNVRLGKSWNNTRPGSGSAWNWPALARDQGYSVSSTPRVGAIISWQASSLSSPWGHVAIVEAVNGDGTIDISEYNWQPFVYTYRKNVNPYHYGGHSYIY